MAKTLKNIRDQVRSFLDEPDAQAADWTNSELNTLINTYYHRVSTAVAKVFENYEPLSTSTFDTVADQQEYDLSTLISDTILSIERVEINYDVDNSDSVPERAIPMEIDAVRRDLANQNLGVTINRGANYYLVGNKIGFLPVPDKDGTDAVKIWYTPQTTDLTSDSDTINLPYPDRDWILIAYGAAAEALRFGQQEPIEAERLQRMYERGIEQMQEDLEDRVGEESKFVIDVTGENIDFQDTYGGF